MFDQHEPDAPGVLIAGTPPSSLHGGSATRTAQHLAVEAARRDFSRLFLEALERARIHAREDLAGRRSRR